MLFDPFCFVRFVEDNGVNILEYIDNWAEGQKPICYFFDDLVIDMQECKEMEFKRNENTK